jgi:hypothetical protein
MGKFDSFNKKVNLDSLQDQMAKAADQNGTGDFKDVEKGQYRVQLVKMEVGECGPKAKIPGAPLLKVDFKILPSEEFGNKFKNSHLFLNTVLYTDRDDDKWNMGKLMKNVIGWLDSLEPSDDIGEVQFEDYDQFADLVLDIAEDVSSLEYDITYDPDGFNKIQIDEVYES